MKTTAEKLIKTANSLTAHVLRGNTINGLRSQELIDRYTDLKNTALVDGSWNAFCELRGWDHTHDAYDFFA